MLVALTTAIPDAYTGEDGVLRIKFEIEASQMESVFLANQLLLEDLFIQTASLNSLKLHGEQYGLQPKAGLPAFGSLRFTGTGGTYIPIGAEAAYDPGQGLDVQFFSTTQDGTIPNPGVALAPTVAVGAAGSLTGLYEYAVTFVTAEGETMQSVDSQAVSPNAQQVNLSAIPLGGPGTVARRIYRQKSGAGLYRRVTEISNNTATTYTDNMADATWAGQPQAPSVRTDNSITLAAQARVWGFESNVQPGTITVLTNTPNGVSGVSNPGAFVGGTDEEDTEQFRLRLLEYVRNPQTGSAADLKSWAEDVPGVESATVFENDNLGTPINGHVTVRVSGPGGTTVPQTVLDTVYATLKEQDLANISIHVAGFNPLTTDVAVDVSLEGTYTLADVSAMVQQEIVTYIHSIPVGGTLYVAGIIDAVFSLPGILDVTVTTPSSNQTTPTDSKRIPGVITVT